VVVVSIAWGCPHRADLERRWQKKLADSAIKRKKRLK
jgi:hypothetical protein